MDVCLPRWPWWFVSLWIRDEPVNQIRGTTLLPHRSEALMKYSLPHTSAADNGWQTRHHLLSAPGAFRDAAQEGSPPRPRYPLSPRRGLSGTLERGGAVSVNACINLFG